MSQTRRFEIELPPDLAAYVQEQVAAGAYASDDAVMSEAVRALQAKPFLDAQSKVMRAEIAAADANGRASIADDDLDGYFQRRADLPGARGDHA